MKPERASGAPPPSVLYIGGAGRSGSTLLERLVAATPGVFAAGELRWIWQRGFAENQLCSCGAPFLECEIWGRVAAEVAPVDAHDMVRLSNEVARTRRTPQLLAAALRHGRFGAEVERYVSALGRLYRGIGSVTGARRIVDSSKEAPYAFVLRSIPDLDLFVVHLVRDSRAVAFSWQRRKQRPEIHWRVQYMPQYRPAIAAREWMRHNLLMEALVQTRRAGWVRLRYEDFARAPTVSVDSLVARWSKASPPFDRGAVAASALPLHTVSGNPIRFERDTPAVEVDAEWVHAMDRGSRRLVGLITYPLLVRYGYARVSLSARV